MARHVAGELVPELVPDLSDAAKRQGEIAPEARRAYLEAQYLNSFQEAFDPAAAAERLRFAIALEPGYVEAHSLLIAALYNQELYEEGEAQARHTLTLDPGNARSALAIGHMELLVRHRPAAAAPWYRRALDAAPHDVSMLRGHALWLLVMGRPEEGTAVLRDALEWDPVSPIVHGDLPWYSFYARRYDDAAEQARRGVDLLADPAPAFYTLFFAAMARGDESSALASVRELLKRQEPPADDLLARLDSLDADAAIETFLSYHLEGPGEPNYFLSVARLQTLLGRRDEALAELGRVVEEREFPMWYLDIDPVLDALRGEPRFEALVEQMEALRAAHPPSDQ